MGAALRLLCCAGYAVLCRAVLCCAVLCCAVTDHCVVLRSATQLHMCSVRIQARATSCMSASYMFTDRHINKGSKFCALTRAVTIPGGFVALAAVANQMVVQSSCSTLAPVIQALFQIYPTIQDLDLSSAQLAEVQQTNPQLVSCIVSSIA